MPGSTSGSEIPDDIRFLKDFPRYDESFQDSPRFRQNLSTWAGKTEKVCLCLCKWVYVCLGGVSRDPL